MAQSEMLTHDGYPAVQLENGSHMTEYSITVTDPRLNGGRPTNIPSLWERKIVDQDTAVDKALKSKKEYKSFDTIKEAVSDSERKSNAGGANAPEGYNRGGAVRNLLATGGMMQEGGTTDPVSGNDVPAGALKEEVRDSVDAKLSVGEFVFPADVTRYIGLDKLMQIRDAAKEGLQEMDSKGQMGNAEEVADNSGNEDKFSSHIDEIIAGLGSGEGESKKFASGGSVNADYSGAPIKGFKMVQYEDVQTKTVKYIPFINGKPLLPIPKGYTEKKETVTPPTTPPPVVEQPVSPVAGSGGAGDRGGRSTDGEGGGGGTASTRDTGVEGFGDIQGGTNRNIGRIAGFAAGLINPVLGLLVSAASQYSIKENNKKIAAANAAAIDASALKEMGFTSAEVKAAQEAAAKATLEGKNAKEIAVATANAIGSSNPESPKTTLDALIGITNGFNTTSAAQIKADNMPDSLKDKVPVGAWTDVVKNIEKGDTPEKAVEKAVTAYGLEGRVGYQSTFDSGVTTTTSATTTEAQVDRMLSDSGLEGRVPAGKYDSVVKDIRDGLTPEAAVAKAVSEATQEKFKEQMDNEAAAKETARLAKEQADKEASEKAAQEKAAKEQADKEAAQRAAEESAKREAEYKAEREKADQEAKDAQERAAAQEQADKAARDAVDRAAEKVAQERAASEAAAAREAEARDVQTRQEAAERAQSERERAEREQADRESRGGGSTPAPSPPSNPGDPGRGGGGAHAGGNGGEGGGLGAGSGGGRYA